MIRNHFVIKALLAASLLGITLAYATGVKPETSIVLVDAGAGEGTMNVKNTDSTPVLLYTKLENIPEDKAPLLIVTPPIARLDGGETQQVRFILNTREPITVEHLKRVSFEGIPTVDKNGMKSKVTVVIRQDLPVIIQPANLPPKRDPWTLLQWSLQGGQLVVNNASPYVVRLAQAVQLLPSKASTMLPAAYILPGQHFKLKINGSPAQATKVRIFPATIYGYSVPSYDAPLTRAPATKTSAPAPISVQTTAATPSPTSAAKP